MDGGSAGVRRNGRDERRHDHRLEDCHARQEVEGRESGQPLAGAEVPTWSPRVIAYSASSNRSDTPSLSKMVCRWFFTVCSLRDSFEARSWFLKPCATRLTISCSRVLNREELRSRPGAEFAGLDAPPPETKRCITVAVVRESIQSSPACTRRMLSISSSVRSEERRVG